MPGVAKLDGTFADTCVYSTHILFSSLIGSSRSTAASGSPIDTWPQDHLILTNFEVYSKPLASPIHPNMIIRTSSIHEEDTIFRNEAETLR